MSQFTTPLIGYFNDDMTLYTLTEEFEYHVGSYPSQNIISVPSGFETDFASVPKSLRWVVSPFGRYGKAAVLHDYLYANAIGTKEYADDIFNEAMKVLGVNPLTRWVMYTAVRLFGRGNYTLSKSKEVTNVIRN